MLSVLKYGGHALASEHHLQHLISQVRRQSHQSDAFPLVVVSTITGITERLHTLACLVRESHAHEASVLLEQIKHRHRERAREVVHDPAHARALLHTLEVSFWDLDREVEQLHHLPSGSAAVPWHITRVATWGERLAVLLVAAALEDAGIHADALPEALVLTAQPPCDEMLDGIVSAPPLLQETRKRACRMLLPVLGHQCVPVVAGGLAQTRRGSIISLGKQGADLAAALLAVALHARSLTIFTNVAGILSADPHLVPDAVPLHTLSAEEALALLTPGAKLVHPRVIPLLAAAAIPLHMRSLFTPDASGTQVIPAPPSSSLTAALALHPAVALLTFTGRAHPDLTDHLTQMLRLVTRIGVVPLMLTLTTSFQVMVLIEEQAVESVLDTCTEIPETWEIHCQKGLAACHGIGEQFGRNPLLRAEAVMALLDEEISVISQGCSEVGMMVVVQATDGARAIRCLHQSFIASVVPSHSQASVEI